MGVTEILGSVAPLLTGVGGVFVTWLTMRGKRTEGLDAQLEDIRKEWRDKVASLEQRVTASDNRILELERARMEDRAAYERARMEDRIQYERFQDRVLNTIEFKQNDPLAWGKLAADIHEERRNLRRKTDRLRILLAEDNTDTRMLVERVLLQANYHVETATSGEAALMFYGEAASRREQFDLLLLDYNLTEGGGPIDGGEVVRTIRDLHHDVTTPIVILTAYERESLDNVNAYNVHVWKKPILPDDLCKRVKELLQ
jgi:CheY-like chemotaxis protein